MESKETRGYLTVRGRIFGLDKKEPYADNYKRVLNFSVKTSEENFIPVQIGGWLSSTFTIKIKAEGMNEAVDVEEQEAIDQIRAIFKNGDDVYLNLRTEVDKYHNAINYKISRIYISTEKLDFESADFKEENTLKMPFIIAEKINGNDQKCVVLDYKGEVVECNLVAKDNIVKNFLNENVNPGDLVPMMVKHKREVIREEVKDSKPVEGQRKTLMGEVIGQTNNQKQGKIIGSKDTYIILDIDVQKIEANKYQPSEFMQQEESEDNPF